MGSPGRILLVLRLAASASALPMWTDSVFTGRPASGPASPAAAGTPEAREPWLPMQVRHRTLADLEDTGALSRDAAAKPAPPRDSSRLKIDGYKTIRVGVGGGGGVALDQSLLLDADGDLSPGVHLKARISDGNMPLSSQGSSAALRDVDELWIDVQSKEWGTRLGDQDWILGPGLGAGFQRRLRGWSGTWRSDDAQLSAAIGGPRARWARLSLEGVEGQQEGYVLVREATDVHGAIVPGSERVRINGEEMRRGGDADYTVRYAQGLLDFTSRRRIHASDRIEVEFQAADLDYERVFAGGTGSGRTGILRWEAWAVRETDQADQPLSYASDSTTRRILSQAGADSSLAVDSAGVRIALPRQVGEAGVRLGAGDSALWIRTDARGASLDRNVLSSRDAKVSGMFAAAEAGMRAGDFLSGGGRGRWTLRGRGEVLESGFQGLSSADTLGTASSEWAGDPAVSRGARTGGGGELSWEAAPGLGVWTRAQARDQGGAFLSLGGARAGMDRGPDRQFLASGSWSRRDDGVAPLDLGRGGARASWPVGAFVPRAQGDLELRDSRVGDSSSRRTSRWGSAGSRWNGPSGWVLDAQGSARADATDRGGEFRGGVDTALQRGLRGSAKWSGSGASLDMDADWSGNSRRSGPGMPWTESGSWIGDAAGSAAPIDGFRLSARWRLSTSSYQPEVASYDTVPAGTGAFAWDSVLREVVPSDKGNLRYAGTRLDTSRPAVRAAQRSVGGEVEIVPGRIRRDLRGLLADLGARIHGELEQTDSSARLKILPDWRDGDLSRCPQAQSLLETTLWWTRSGSRLEGFWSRRLSMGMSSVGMREREMVERVTWGTPVGASRAELVGEHGEIRQSETGYVRREERWRGEPSFAWCPAGGVEIRPGWIEALGEGEQSTTAFRSLLSEPYVALALRLPRNLGLRSDLRRASVDATGPVGSRVTEGFPEGTTWRASAGLDWKWKDRVQARGDWTLRMEPGRPSFQKLSFEARANF